MRDSAEEQSAPAAPAEAARKRDRRDEQAGGNLGAARSDGAAAAPMKKVRMEGGKASEADDKGRGDSDLDGDASDAELDIELERERAKVRRLD